MDSPDQGQQGRSRREALHDALEAARAENRAQAQRLEDARVQLPAIADWIETGRPQREVLRESAFARMQARLESLPVIEQAKGVLMAQQRCGPEEAFDMLRRASQRANLKLHVLAAQIVGQVATPQPPPAPSPPPRPLPPSPRPVCWGAMSRTSPARQVLVRAVTWRHG